MTRGRKQAAPEPGEAKAKPAKAKPAKAKPAKPEPEPEPEGVAHDYAANEAAGREPLPIVGSGPWPNREDVFGARPIDVGGPWPSETPPAERSYETSADVALAELLASGAVVFEGGRYYARAHAPSLRATRSRAGAYAVRTALGFTQEEFARLLGVTPRTVTRWETGGGDASGHAAWLVATLDELARCHDGRDIARGLLHSESPVTAWLVVLERVSREPHSVAWGMK